MIIKINIGNFEIRIPLWLMAAISAILAILKLTKILTITWVVVLFPLMAWFGSVVLLFVLILIISVLSRIFNW